jgi:hypothetical protein
MYTYTMSPRHFSKAMLSKTYNKDVSKIIEGQPNLWYAFTAVTGIAKLFSYTPPTINNNPVKDSQSGIDITI